MICINLVQPKLAQNLRLAHAMPTLPIFVEREQDYNTRLNMMKGKMADTSCQDKSEENSPPLPHHLQAVESKFVVKIYHHHFQSRHVPKMVPLSSRMIKFVMVKQKKSKTKKTINVQIIKIMEMELMVTIIDTSISSSVMNIHHHHFVEMVIIYFHMIMSKIIEIMMAMVMVPKTPRKM